MLLLGNFGDARRSYMPHVCTSTGRGHGTPNGENISHCLEQCGVYMCMSPNQCKCMCRICKSVPSSSTWYSFICQLQPRDRGQRIICGVDGCTKHHHKSLYGSPTPLVASVHSTQHDVSADHVHTINSYY